MSMAIQAVHIEIQKILAPVKGDVSKLDSDSGELLLCYERAEMELKSAYMKERESTSNFPPYEELIKELRWVR